jgi:hypothetical protein
LGILGLLLLAGTTVHGGERKKLIEFGWDEPDTSFIRKHIGEMERTPFDGCVFHINYAKPDRTVGSFTWEGWGTKAFTEEELKADIEDLKGTHFGRLRENFVRFNVTPGKIDWFDDFSAVLHNAGLAARVARLGKCRGILFDIEEYEALTFQYRTRRDAGTKSWQLYAGQARKRGREGVADQNRYTATLDRAQSFGVQDFGAAAREFGGFLIGDFRDGACVRRQARVGGHQPIHIGPDDDFVSRERCAQNRRGVVGTPAAKCRQDSIGGRADEARDNRNNFLLQERTQARVASLARELH